MAGVMEAVATGAEARVFDVRVVVGAARLTGVCAARVGAVSDADVAVSASCTTGVPTVFRTGAGAGATGAGAETSGAVVCAAAGGAVTTGGGGATTTGAAWTAVLSLACANKGVEDKAITAAIAVIAGRSGERLVFIARDQSAT